VNCLRGLLGEKRGGKNYQWTANLTNSEKAAGGGTKTRTYVQLPLLEAETNPLVESNVFPVYLGEPVIGDSIRKRGGKPLGRGEKKKKCPAWSGGDSSSGGEGGVPGEASPGGRPSRSGNLRKGSLLARTEGEHFTYTRKRKHDYFSGGGGRNEH